MKIHHTESGITLEVREDHGSFLLADSRTQRTHVFKEAYEAIWFGIEIIRGISYGQLTHEQLIDIAARNNLNINNIHKDFILRIQGEKPLTTYYDQSFMRLLSSYRAGVPEVAVNNATGFVIEQEVVAQLRALAGVRLTMPS